MTLGARTYDPYTAQFTTNDPALQNTGEPYSYGQDNPENREDFSGECAAAVDEPGIVECAKILAEIAETVAELITDPQFTPDTAEKLTELIKETEEFAPCIEVIRQYSTWLAASAGTQLTKLGASVANFFRSLSRAPTPTIQKGESAASKLSGDGKAIEIPEGIPLVE
jgi:hypothetical protein